MKPIYIQKGKKGTVTTIFTKNGKITTIRKLDFIVKDVRSKDFIIGKDGTDQKRYCEFPQNQKKSTDMDGWKETYKSQDFSEIETDQANIFYRTYRDGFKTLPDCPYPKQKEDFKTITIYSFYKYL